MVRHTVTSCIQKYNRTHLPKVIKVLHDHGHKSSLRNFGNTEPIWITIKKFSKCKKIVKQYPIRDKSY